MSKNVGSLDRMIRMILAVIFFSLFFLLDGEQKYFAVIGFVPLLTGLISFCPLYKVVGVCTRK